MLEQHMTGDEHMLRCKCTVMLLLTCEHRTMLLHEIGTTTATCSCHGTAKRLLATTCGYLQALHGWSPMPITSRCIKLS